MLAITRDIKAKCCGNILKAGTKIKDLKIMGPRTVIISTSEGHVHKIKMRENSDLIQEILP